MKLCKKSIKFSNLKKYYIILNFTMSKLCNINKNILDLYIFQNKFKALIYFMLKVHMQLKNLNGLDTKQWNFC